MDRNQKIDEALESVLLAGGLSFKHIPNEKALNAMREAMLKVMKESYVKGSNATLKRKKSTNETTTHTA